MNNNVAFVDAGVLFSFITSAPQPKQTVQNQNDILDSTLLAQLAADKKYSRFQKSQDWYRYYTDTLGELGWDNPFFNFDDYFPKNKTFTLKDVVIHIFQKLANDQKISNAELVLVEDTINIFNKLANDDKRVNIYNSFTNFVAVDNSNASSSDVNNPGEIIPLKDLRTINLQVDVVDQSLNLASVGIILTTKQKIEKKLFTQGFLTSLVQGKITSVSYLASLNEGIYSQVRKQVIEKLGDKREQFILKLI
ncbi:hypothetical protein [uncultured Nostoc sp.]|uniref:hypothetical protein n=1 Tax=uncultured Nostoc sp. TaxID=340711 RepID=UPI0035CC7C86